MVEEKIIKFIGKHHLLTLATVATDGSPYCASCFYAYDKVCNRFVFTTDDTTAHGSHMLNCAKVACNIALETRVVGKIQGLQICGEARRGDDEARMTYIKRFPYAAVMPLNVWVVEPDFMKLTDNTLGFGKKLIWNRQK